MELFALGLLALAVAASPFIFFVLHLVNRDRMKRLEKTVATLQARVDELAGSAEPRSAGAPAADSTRQAPMPPAPPAAAAQPPAKPQPAAPAPRPKASPRSSADWEEIIGGNWLNKIGVVVTVVGIALALGYSMRYLGPAGRVVLALAMSGSMLGIGATLEHRERYRLFARGLIGGGWAGLYFTTFAMHGLEAARIIESPVVGTVLLLAVAVGMVLHSLVYKSETVTGLAYFMTFATLAVVPVTRFALAASLPAAASLLFVGRRFRWGHMMVAGVVFTYGAYLLRGGSPDVGPEDWAFGQALLFAYWLMFEAFDLLSLKGRKSGGWGDTLMPLNAAGFIGTSLLGWSEVHPDTLWMFFLAAAAMFVASALVRARLLGDQSAGEEASGRLRAGSYEGPILIAAVLMVFSIADGFEGWRQNVAWLLEAQFLILTGVLLKNRFLRYIGSGVLVVPVVQLLTSDLVSRDTFELFGITWFRWTPLALLTAAVLYFDRALVRGMRHGRVAGLEHAYNWVATALVAWAVALEVPDAWIAPSWLAMGLLLIALSKQRGASELFVQGYFGCALSWLVMLALNVPTSDQVFGLQARWMTAVPMVALFYGLAYVGRNAEGADPETGGDPSPEALGAPVKGMNGLAQALVNSAPVVLFAAATFLTSWFLLFEVSGSWLTVAWGLQGVALLAVGFAMGVRGARLTGLGLLGLCIFKLFFYDLSELEGLFRIFAFIVLGLLMLMVSFAYSRYREEIRRLL